MTTNLPICAFDDSIRLGTVSNRELTIGTHNLKELIDNASGKLRAAVRTKETRSAISSEDVQQYAGGLQSSCVGCSSYLCVSGETIDRNDYV